jgi:hypothetical protein
MSLLAIFILSALTFALSAITAWLVNQLPSHNSVPASKALKLLVGLTVLSAVVALGIYVAQKGDNTSAATPRVTAPSTYMTTSSNPSPTGTGTTTGPQGGSTSPSDATVTKFLGQNPIQTDDPDVLPPVDGYIGSAGPQSINGVQFTRSLNFTFACADNYQKFADYNLGRHYDKFTTTVGPSDVSKSKGYHFEVWKDSHRFISITLALGSSKRIDMPVKGVLRLKIVACATDNGGYPDSDGGGIFGDPQVAGKASEVPDTTPTG